MGSTVKDVMSTHVIAMQLSLTTEGMRSRVNAVSAADLMTKPAVTIGADESVTRAARLMFDQRVKRLPVTSDDGTLIGILSRSDVLSVHGRPDAQIRQQVTQDLMAGTLLGDPDLFTVIVRNGIVTIEGDAKGAAVKSPLPPSVTER